MNSSGIVPAALEYVDQRRELETALSFRCVCMVSGVAFIAGVQLLSVENREPI